MNDSPSPETALQKRDRLQREIDERWAQSAAIEADIGRERFAVGLSKVAAAGAWLDVRDFDKHRFVAVIQTNEAHGDCHPLQGCFELDGYHEGFDCDGATGIPGVDRIAVGHNDGVLDIRFSFKEKVAAEVAVAIKRLFAGLNLPLKADYMREEADNLRRQLAAKEVEIAAVEASIP